MRGRVTDALAAGAPCFPKTAPEESWFASGPRADGPSTRGPQSVSAPPGRAENRPRERTKLPRFLWEALFKLCVSTFSW